VNAAELILAHLEAAGVTATVRDGRLILSPRDRLSPELEQQARAFRDRLVAWLSWPEQEARDALDISLERIGRGCPDLAGLSLDQRRVDLEEAINVASWRRDWDAYITAITAYEEHCLRLYWQGAGTP
jgi:hypothetical protein